MITKTNDSSIKDITLADLRKMIEEAVEEKLQEYLGDPDEGLVLREEFGRKLKASLTAVRKGKRGVPLDKLAKGLGFDL
ncbi:MAG: hypothetical protein PHY28_09475 [Dehalococcoidales bacterium]|nr:hypothetical protein [Dehalococcoidales bacterium]